MLNAEERRLHRLNLRIVLLSIHLACMLPNSAICFIFIYHTRLKSCYPSHDGLSIRPKYSKDDVLRSSNWSCGTHLKYRQVDKTNIYARPDVFPLAENKPADHNGQHKCVPFLTMTLHSPWFDCLEIQNNWGVWHQLHKLQEYKWSLEFFSAASVWFGSVMLILFDYRTKRNFLNCLCRVMIVYIHIPFFILSAFFIFFHHWTHLWPLEGTFSNRQFSILHRKFDTLWKRQMNVSCPFFLSNSKLSTTLELRLYMFCRSKNYHKVG